jgi:hypothetical protein
MTKLLLQDTKSKSSVAVADVSSIGHPVYHNPVVWGDAIVTEFEPRILRTGRIEAVVTNAQRFTIPKKNVCWYCTNGEELMPAPYSDA